MKKKFFAIGAAVAGIILISIFFHLRSPNIPDPDSFYHIRHAWIYRTTSFFNTSFPWVSFTVLKNFPVDLWYGFHIFLAPFSYFGDLVLGIKWAGIFLTSLLLFAFVLVAGRFKLSMRFLWPFVFLLAVPNSLFQLLMARPHMISLALAVLLLYFLIEGRWWTVFLASAGIVFFHLSFFWLASFLAFAVWASSAFKWHLVPLPSKKALSFGRAGGQAEADLKPKKFNFIKISAVFGGTIAGWLLQPNPLDAAKLVYIQVVKLIIEKQSDLPLLFAKELTPLKLQTLFQTSWPFLFLWVTAVLIFVWILVKYRYQNIFFKEKTFLLANFAVSLVFFLLTIFVARRSLVWWVAFGTLFTAAAYTFIISGRSYKNFFAFLIIAAFFIMIPFSIYQNGKSMVQSAAPPTLFKDASRWLEENSQSGDIVFNAHWDNFSPLFFWNQKNYYIGGMDPIFQYAYSPSLYWKFHHLSKDETAGLTCGAAECHSGNAEDAYKVLTGDFNAKYVLIEKRRNPHFFSYLESDRRFKKEFDNGKEAVFLVGASR